MNYQIVLDGAVEGVDGTSCAAPVCLDLPYIFPSVRLNLSQTAAGVISLLNDFRISNGKPPLGFLNPLLYTSASEGFNEITSGSNPGCGTQGFEAMAGWNPVCSEFEHISERSVILIILIRHRSPVLERQIF